MTMEVSGMKVTRLILSSPVIVNLFVVAVYERNLIVLLPLLQ